MTHLSTVSHRRTRLSVMAATAIVALTGCGSLHPGTAVVVDSTTITHDEVEAVANVLCTADMLNADAEGKDASNLPSKGSRQFAMQILLDTQLSLAFGEQEGIEPNQQVAARALAESVQFIEALPEDQRDDFRDARVGVAEAASILSEIGRQSLEEQGQRNVAADQAIAEGQRLRGEFVKTIDVEVDPRYGTFAEGTFTPGASALSVPVSDTGLAGAKASPGPDFADGLPASQKCS